MSLLKQSVILTIARTLTMAVQFISPIFLVRILAPLEYGLYQEFIVYAMLTVSFVEFSANANLLYFIPRDPGRARQYLTATTALNAGMTLLGVIAVLVFHGQLARLTSWDITRPLLIYLVTYVNLDYLEMYWIATHRSINVLCYGLSMAVLRSAVVIATAYYSNDVLTVIYGIILFQVAKCLFVAGYLMKGRLLSLRPDPAIIKAQIRFVLPLGAAGVILYFNNEVSKVIVNAQLGAIALAMYAIGSRQIPITSIVRASVSDVVFPEIVRLNASDPKAGLALWKRTNVVQTFMIVPIFFCAFYYADVIITTLFTRQYEEAVPIFRIYLLLMFFKDGIEMGAPLRAIHRNRVFIYGNILSLVVNVGLLYLLFRVYPFYGPAAALVLTTFALQVFLGLQIMRAYHAGVTELFFWRKHLYLTGAGLAGVPVLLIGELLFGGKVWVAVVFGAFYAIVYLLIVRLLRIGEVDTVLARSLDRARRFIPRAA